VAMTHDQAFQPAGGEEQQALEEKRDQQREADPDRDLHQLLARGQEARQRHERRRSRGQQPRVRESNHASASTVLRSSRFTSAASSFTVRSKSRRSMMLTWLWM